MCTHIHTHANTHTQHMEMNESEIASRFNLEATRGRAAMGGALAQVVRTSTDANVKMHEGVREGRSRRIWYGG